MNKEQFRIARKMVRANGRSAYRWIGIEAATCFHALAEPSEDYLKERAWWREYSLCKARNGRAIDHPARLVPCPSQCSAMYKATTARTKVKHWADFAVIMA